MKLWHYAACFKDMKSHMQKRCTVVCTRAIVAEWSGRLEERETGGGSDGLKLATCDQLLSVCISCCVPICVNNPLERVARGRGRNASQTDTNQQTRLERVGVIGHIAQLNAVFSHFFYLFFYFFSSFHSRFLFSWRSSLMLLLMGWNGRARCCVIGRECVLFLSLGSRKIVRACGWLVILYCIRLGINLLNVTLRSASRSRE